MYYFFIDTNYGMVLKFSNTGYMDHGRGIDIFSIFAFWDTDFMTVNILQENIGIDKKILNTQKAPKQTGQDQIHSWCGK